MTTALLILNGELSSPAKVKLLAKEADVIVAADGGARHCRQLKLAPDLVIGDMDSLPRPLPKWKNTAFCCDFDEDRSDFEKALEYLEGMEAGPVWIVGALGGRPDHALVNLSLIEHWARRLPLVLADGGLAQPAGPGRYAYACGKGAAVTLLPITGSCRLSTRGLRYTLKNETLRRGSRGLSNRTTAGEFKVHVHSGRLWIMLPE
ncbi:MAG: thiamine diphosphokinase [Elusimicrobiota bacterium]